MKIKKLLIEFKDNEKTKEKYTNKVLLIATIGALAYSIVYIALHFSQMSQTIFFTTLFAVPVLVLAFMIVGLASLMTWSMFEVIKRKLTKKYQEIKMKKQLYVDIPKKIESVRIQSEQNFDFDKLRTDMAKLPPNEAIQVATATLLNVLQNKVITPMGSISEILSLTKLRVTC